MISKSLRVFCLVCLVVLVGASRASEAGLWSTARVFRAVARDRHDRDRAWPEPANLALLGAGLGYVGLRLRKA